MVRPIIINTHIAKIYEKTILSKLKLKESSLLLCTELLDRILGWILGIEKPNPCNPQYFVVLEMPPQKRDLLLLFNLWKAFDSIKRYLLWLILLEREKSPGEKFKFKLIIKLHSRHEIIIDKELTFTSKKGVPQSVILSPHLFNIYLDHCLNQTPIRNQAIENQTL